MLVKWHLIKIASLKDMVTQAQLQETATQEKHSGSVQSGLVAYLSQILGSSCQLSLFQPAEINHVQAGSEGLCNP